MNRNQWIVIIAAVALFIAMYFGCETTPDQHKIIEKQRLDNVVSTDISSLLMDAKKDLSPNDESEVLALEMGLNNSSNDSEKSKAYKELSSIWYKLNKPAIAGYYAEQVALIENNEDAWSITGTTFSICVQRETEPKVKSYCTDHAVSALENATSLNPSNLQHAVNLALVYTENPPAETPMKGILMLVELNKQNPENVSVLNQLGRLAIKTGQLDKAVQRLSKAVELEPENPMSNCLLGKAFEEMNEQVAASPYLAKCKELTNN
ncbi:MAG: tetratricopeptide repeat protein [Saprospiraceae bacterium]